MKASYTSDGKCSVVSRNGFLGRVRVDALFDKMLCLNVLFVSFLAHSVNCNARLIDGYFCDKRSIVIVGFFDWLLQNFFCFQSLIWKNIGLFCDVSETDCHRGVNPLRSNILKTVLCKSLQGPLRGDLFVCVYLHVPRYFLKVLRNWYYSPFFLFLP